MQWLEAKPDPGKSCGSCTLCCKLFDVDWLEAPKPAGKWCGHCMPGKGCRIWQNLPSRCADYFCVWRIDPALGADWRPDRARFILSHAHREALLAVVIDPAFPDAHRREPYASILRKTALQHLEGRGSTVVIFRGTARALLMPDEEIPIPDPVALHEIRIEKRERAGQVTWSALFPKR